MSEIALFDRTVQETHTWLREIGEAMEDPRRKIAYHALRGTLVALRDRLTVEEAHDLGAQLPTLVRGLFFEGYHPAGKPEKYHRKAFLARVEGELRAAGGANPEKAARAVLQVVARHVSRGEVLDVWAMLPGDLRDLWPAAAPQSAEAPPAETPS